MKKPAELELIKVVVQNSGRIPSDYWNLLTKKDYRYLDKWEEQGLWEYGVSSRSGWLTPEGKFAFQEFMEEINAKNKK